jgi:hypothetical protein
MIREIMIKNFYGYTTETDEAKIVPSCEKDFQPAGAAYKAYCFSTVRTNDTTGTENGT